MQLHFIVEEILHLGSPVPISKSLMHYARKPDQISHEGEMEPEARGAVRQGRKATLHAREKYWVFVVVEMDSSPLVN